jgi:hexosaminidase
MPENKDWKRFSDSADELCSIYDQMGYNYGKHIFNARGKVQVNKSKCRVEVELEAQGDTPVNYTLDGSEPTQDSHVYEEPIEITGDCTLKAVSFRSGEATMVYEKTFSSHKAMGRPSEMHTKTHESYTFTCPDMLTDGIRGAGPYNSGDFAGWCDSDVEVIIDMSGTSYSSVTLSGFAFKYDWIFPPTDMTISVSENGKDFTQIAHAEYVLEGGIDDGNGCQEHTLTFPESSARYLKIHAGCIRELPEWHDGAGRPGFLFVDEIIVK